MPSPKQTDAEIALHLLGQRVREGWSKQHPLPEKNLTIFKDAVREDFERSKQPAPPPPLAKDSRDREPEEPDLGR